MAVCESTTPRPAGGAIDDERLRWLVETDRRKGAIGLHIASDITRAARTSTVLWLPPGQAEAVARAILAAVEGWQADQAVTAWTSTTGGQCNG